MRPVLECYVLQPGQRAGGGGGGKYPCVRDHEGLKTNTFFFLVMAFYGGLIPEPT